MTYQNPQQEDLDGNSNDMKRPEYKIKLESDYYSEVETTSEGLLILWEDDGELGQRLKIENKKRRKEDDGEFWQD